jgi:AcrR family transcriptional regulator
MSARAEAAAATRERLLSAAWEQFATRPYEEVHLAAVAAEAGVSAQTLHNIFRSKEQLLTAAFVWWGVPVMAGRDMAPIGKVGEAVENLFDHYELHGRAILRMISQEERFPAIRQMTDVGRIYHREWAVRTFQQLLEGLRGKSRERRLAGIVLATDLLAWRLLRLDMQIDRIEAERIVVEMVEGSGSKR